MTDQPITDPKDLPAADPHTGQREVDPVTGYETTGHDWSGIKELNTPFPKIVIWAFGLTFLYAIITWVLLPAWPYGRDYSRGLLGLEQGEMAAANFAELDARRQDWIAQFDGSPDFEVLDGDADLMATAMPAANRLFLDNCSVCHGAQGEGGPGFPVLNDIYWLWGGGPETVAETLRVGINAAHPDTRWAQMPAFDWMERQDRQQLAEHVAALRDGKADPDGAGATLFAENCVACHGEAGVGGLMNGAPALTDTAVIYGQDAASVNQTLRFGRQGVMPYWSDRLSDAEINLIALYVKRLSEEIPE